MNFVLGFCIFIYLNGIICSMGRAYSQIYQKMFKSFDTKVIKQCQFYMGQTNVKLKIVSRRIKFLNGFRNNTNIALKLFTNMDKDLTKLTYKYKLKNVPGVPKP
jgi:hypothetical protein